eukprot:m.37266 g.37266  ORF g.37266 m.37266 type:complete len:161 (-) comp16201_c0_seq1:157-639(-)
MGFCDGIEVRESAKHGKGLFATKFIPKGTIIWSFSGGKNLVGDEPNQILKREELEAMGQSDADRLRTVLWGTYLHAPTGVCIELRDGGQYTNHSDEPNLDGTNSRVAEEDMSVALRDIQPGEELTEDYRVYEDFTAQWLVNLFKEYVPARYEFETKICGH